MAGIISYKWLLDNKENFYFGIHTFTMVYNSANQSKPIKTFKAIPNKAIDKTAEKW